MTAPTDTQATLLPLRQMIPRALGVLLVVAAVVAVGLGLRWYSNAGQEERTAEALDAARTRTAHVLTYDGASLDTGLARARQQVTGEFAARLDGIANDLLGPTGQADAVSTTATVARAAVVASRPDRVQVLLYVDQVTSSATQPVPRSTTGQVLVTMTLVEDQWLISEYQPL